MVKFLKAKPGRPPSREYKQSMAKPKSSPLPGPVKRNFNQNIVHSPETGNQTQKKEIITLKQLKEGTIFRIKEPNLKQRS